MLALAETAGAWSREGRAGVVARVVEGEGLGPRATDELLLLDPSGPRVGSLLGGVLDHLLAGEARGVVDDDQTQRVVRLPVREDDASAAGLTCGGSVSVLLQPIARIPSELWSSLAEGRPAALVTMMGGEVGPLVVRPGRPVAGTLGGSALEAAAEHHAGALLARPGVSRERFEVEGIQLLVEAWSPVPRVVLFGVNDLARAVVRQAELLGWEGAALAEADRAVERVAGLGPGDAVIVLDHDHVAATRVLVAGLRGAVGYVGALGSRRTQEIRRRHLDEAGISPDELDRLHGPTGLDLGARTPAETAVSIAAEILAVRSGRSPGALRESAGSIKA